MATKKKDAEVIEQATVAADATQDQEGVKDDSVNYNYPEIIKSSLLKTGREGMVDLIDYMDQIGFFKAPCSGQYHLAKEGGLAEHSVNVMWAAEKLSVALIGGKNLTDEIRHSITIVTLLHDLGKVGDFGKQMYVDNILKSGKPSATKPYKRNKELTNVPHAVRSVKLATLFLDLTEEEEWAILTHDGLYDFMKYDIPGNETQLSLILHWADMWASHIIEKDDTAEDADE